MTNISERILKLSQNEGISIRSLEQKIGCSNGVIAKSIQKGTDISSTWVSKIVDNFPQYNAEWILTGKGETKKDISIEKHLAYQANKSKKGIPLISLDVAAGFGNSNFSIADQDIQELYVVPDFNGIDFMIRVKGNSMYPKYSSGDIIACRKINERGFIQWNKCHVIATREQGLLVKRLKKGSNENNILAISDNKEYDPFEIPKEEITGIALVVGVIRLE